METPGVVVERERERERVASSPRFPRRHKLLFGALVIIGVFLYAGFNLWVYQYSTSGKASSPKALWQTMTKSESGFERLTGPGPVTTPSPSPTPTPPPTGPGQYACDEYGICNLYEDARRVGCPKTYADPHCQNECGDTTVRCQKPK